MTLDGCLLVYKESGVSSFGVIERLQRILAAATGLKKRDLPKFGHGGTLDPFATGLLIVCSGEGTKLSRYFLGSNKEYRGVIRFGETTIPGDPTDPVSERSDHLPSSRAEIQGVADSFCVARSHQAYLQTPPMHSAKKIDGKRLYELAREGIEVARKAIECRIDEFEISSYESPTAHYRVRCSAGTFIRVLGQDLGRRLGTVAMLDRLERTGSGKFTLDQCMTLGELERTPAAQWSQLKCFVPLDRMLAASPRLELSVLEARELRHGLVIRIQQLEQKTLSLGTIVAAFDPEGHLAAVFSEGRLDRVFHPPVQPPRA